MHRFFPRVTVFCLLRFLSSFAQAGVAPYSVDANTVMLYHFDEASGGSSVSAVSGKNNLYTWTFSSSTGAANTTLLGTTGYTGFGKCMNLGTSTTVGAAYDGNGNSTYSGETTDALAMSALGIGGTNAFTLEAIVSPNAVPSVNREIICTDSSAATRGFQFRMTTGGTTGQRLEFNMIGVSGTQVFADIPTSGTHAIAAGNWYHVAFTYNGATAKFYWTKLDSGVGVANQIGSDQTISLTGAGTITGPLVIGNENRAAGGEGAQAKIDEVRISNIARSASGFLFLTSDDSDGDGLKDVWEDQYFGNNDGTATTQELALYSGSSDPDGDGYSNAAEQTAGTNPTDVSSKPTVIAAGTLYVDLRATAAKGAGGATWENQGTLGNFTRTGFPSLVSDVAGTGIPGVFFNGASAYTSIANTVPDLEGSSDRSIEVWAYNPTIVTEESLVSWGRRGSTRTNISLNFGNSTGWGAVTHFNDDLPWGSVPSSSGWHHLVYVYSGSTDARVYVDGVLANSKTLGGVLATAASNPINIGCQRDSGGTTTSVYLHGYINNVRVHGGALTAAQVATNYVVGPVSYVADSDGDGLDDAWEMANFGNLNLNGSADSDSDGHNNADELAAGTDPNDPVSYLGASEDPVRPTGLMVDLLASPEQTTLADTQPEFTWIFQPRLRGDAQTAYEIIVSSTAALAGAGTGDVWSSGKVSSSQSVNVPFGGASLTRGSTYRWRVRTWGQSASPSTWSSPQTFTLESTTGQSGARSLYKASANDSSGYNWAGRYRPAYNESVAPVSVVSKGNGGYFIDFGKDAFGYVKLRLNGAYSGQTMEVRMGEAASGTSVNTSPGGTIRYGSTTLTLADGDNTYEARYASTVTGLYSTGINVTTWAGGGVMPFRYVELVNCPATLTAADIRQEVLLVPFDDNASGFTSSNSTLDSVWALSKYSIKATTFAGAYVDGDRERRPYEADAYLNQLSHYGVDREFATGRYTYEFLLDNHTWPLEWRMHFPLMAWEDYNQTGNTDALTANYASLKSNLLTNYERADGAFVSPNPDGGQTDPADIIDWPAAERDGYSLISSNTVSTVPNAFHYADLRLMAKIATVLGNTADATDFTTRANKIQTLFAGSTFWDSTNQRYKDGESPTHASAHANFFAMAFGLVPEARVASVMSFLKTTRTINGRTEYMPCSVYGAQYFLQALFDGGEDDHAIFLMADSSSSRKRHWQNMITEGSTLTMEAWGLEFKTNQDWNHAWGAAPANLLPRYVLGVKPLTPGYAQTEIKPRLGTGDGTNGLTSASGTVPTIRGPVAVKVTNAPSAYKLEVDIPGNMTAKVYVPSKGLATPTLLMDGAVVPSTVSGDRLVLDSVPSGRHAIWLSATASPDAASLKDNWKAAMFGDDASNAAISGDSADPDGDGYDNAVEFAANTDPLVADSHPFPPTLDALADVTVDYGTASVSIPLTVGDTDTSLDALVLSGSSGNSAVIQSAGISFSGSGASRLAALTPVASATGSATVTLNVGDGLLSASRSFALTVLNQAQTWKRQEFGDNWTNATLADDNADPDGDGVSNLLERAFGGNPNVREQNLLPAKDSSAQMLSITYRKANAASDLTFLVEESADLSAGSWAAAAGTSTVLSDDGTVQLIRFTTSSSAPAKKFVRVKVTSP